MCVKLIKWNLPNSSRMLWSIFSDKFSKQIFFLHFLTKNFGNENYFWNRLKWCTFPYQMGIVINRELWMVIYLIGFFGKYSKAEERTNQQKISKNKLTYEYNNANLAVGNWWILGALRLKVGSRKQGTWVFEITCCLSYKGSPIVNYNSWVIPELQIPHFTTQEHL